MRAHTIAILAAFTSLAMTTAASAQAEPGAAPGADEPTPTEQPSDLTTTESPMSQPENADVALSDEQAALEDRDRPAAVRDDTDPYEDPTESYYFVGAFYRHTFLPEFMLNLFLDDSFSASNPAVGAEVTYRKDGFDIVGSLWYASFSGDGPVRAAGDPEADTEIIHSELKGIFVSGAFLWSTPFNDVFALEYGVDLGLGVLFGDLVRSEAYRDGAGEWQECSGPNDPRGPDPFCDSTSVQDGETGGHFGVKARKWTDGGSVPNVVPWLALPHLALRIKPVKQFMMRIEGGFGLGFFAGASASYGF